MTAALDLVRPIYEAWSRGDFSSAEWADPAIDFAIVGGPNAGRWRGVAAMAAAWADVMNAFDDLRVEPEAYRDLGDGRVLVLLHNRGRGKVSGMEVGAFANRGANVLDVRDGRVARLWIYWERDRALADAGLAEEGAE